MKKLGLLVSVLLICVSPAVAQDDYKKFEFFGGYSLMNFDNAAGNTNNAEVNEVLGEKELLQASISPLITTSTNTLARSSTIRCTCAKTISVAH